MDLMRLLRSQWDRVAAAVLFLVGAVALLLGYLGARDGLYAAEQLPYIISGGIFGLFCIGGAAALLLSADMRDEWRKLDRIDESLRVLVGATTLSMDEPAEDLEPERLSIPVVKKAAPAKAPVGRSRRAATTASRRA